VNSIPFSTPSRAALFAEGKALPDADAGRRARIGLVITIVAVGGLFSLDRAMAPLAFVGGAIGYVLVRSGFGFASGYRSLFEERDAGPVLAQLLLLGLATLVFAFVFSRGELGGRPVEPTVMPVGLALAAGAFMFGVGMQLAGGCGSGSLTSLGGGNGRMVVVLAAFIAGSFAASLHWSWWTNASSLPGVALGDILGWGWGAALQVAAIAVAAVLLARIRTGERQEATMPSSSNVQPDGIAKPWPLASASFAIPVLSLATLYLAGHLWTITWAHTLAGAKIANALGWVPSGGGFWGDGFPAAALSRLVLDDITSVMNGAIVLGAATAANAMGRWSLRFAMSRREMASAVAAGLLMGYGARISFGCNIGAFVVGVASTSLHGWAWIVFAIPGNLLGLKLRPRRNAAR